MTHLNKVICGKIEDVLRQYPPGIFSAVLCDPPYGLGEVRDIEALLKAWLANADGTDQQTAGFMGRDWDKVPHPGIWREVLRVMAPGAFIMAFSGCRTVDLLGISMRLAGFQDNNLLLWLQGQGFPKAADCSKAIDRQEYKRREAAIRRALAEKGYPDVIWNSDHE